MAQSLRLILLSMLICCAWLRLSGPACAEDERGPLRMAAYGRLAKLAGPEGGFGLVDDKGKLLFRLATPPHADLARLVGKTVRVVGQRARSRRADEQTLTAERIAETQTVAPAHFLDTNDNTVDPPPDLILPADAPASSPEGAANAAESANGAAPQPIPLSLPEFPEPAAGEPLPIVMDEDVKMLNDPASGVPSMPEEEGYCAAPEWYWVRPELLIWRSRSMYIPALVTTSPAGTPIDDAGVLGEPGTSILYGDENIFDNWRTGGRLTIGGWLGKKKKYGLEGEFLALREIGSGFAASSMGDEIIARPFINVDPSLGANVGSQDSELISCPNSFAGGISVAADSEFASASLRLRGNIYNRNGCRFDPVEDCDSNEYCVRVDWIGGVRALRLNEELVVGTNQIVSVTPQGGFEVFDDFSTENEFLGGEFGVVAEYIRGRWVTEGLFKLAIGQTQQQVHIAGGTLLGTAGIVTPFEGGLLALPTNIGDYEQKETDLIFELGINVGYMVTKRLRATAGYTLIFWPNVVRPGGEISTIINGSYIPDPTITPSGPMVPAFAWEQTQYWAQGFAFGLDYRW